VGSANFGSALLERIFGFNERIFVNFDIFSTFLENPVSEEIFFSKKRVREKREEGEKGEKERAHKSAALRNFESGSV